MLYLMPLYMKRYNYKMEDLSVNKITIDTRNNMLSKGDKKWH